ncbi:MAG: hypothetical protein ACI8Z1_001507 [Candidatus Azotimanducaceae bacterium]|jgi:hypothetical protein
MDNESSPSIEERQLLGLARQDIEYLRRLYGRATDALGKVDEPDEQKYGQDTFRQIFTSDASVRVTGGATSLEANGPDGWAEVVRGALKDYEVTQHLIGTQIVTFKSMTCSNGLIETGDAEMSSYLHAWHVWPDQKLRLVLGTYIDHVRYVPGVGWQIYDMTLQHSSTEHRLLGGVS